MKIADIAGPVDPHDIDSPVGVYTVDLLDDRGRVKDRRVKSNYISPLYYAASLAGQYLHDFLSIPVANNSQVFFSTSGLSSASNLLGNLLEPTRMWNPTGRPALAIDHLYCTTDDTPENTADTWLRGVITAYASRYKATVAASGARGQINEAECAITNAGQTFKTVWDFTTQQGNGTFQTLGLGAAGPSIATLWAAAGPRSIILNDRSPRGYVDRSIASNVYVDGATCYWIGWQDTATNGNVLLYSAPTASIFGAPAHATDPHVLDASGSPTVVCDTGVNWTTNPGGNSAVSFPYNLGQIGLVRIAGGDFVMTGTGFNSGSSASGSGRNLTVRRFTAAGALVYSVTPAIPVSTSNINGAGVGLAYDGTHLYAVASGDSASYARKVYRLDPATGALTATIDIPTDYGVVSNYGLTFDGTHLLIGCSTGICRMSVAGTAVSPYCYGLPLSSPSSDTGVSPWSTIAGLYGTVSRGVTGLSAQRRSIPVAITGTIPNSQIDAGIIGEGVFDDLKTSTFLGVVGMTVYDGKLWLAVPEMVSPVFAPVGSGGLIAVTGANCFSRTVLDSPITKNTSQNMKISYEVTFPFTDPTLWPEHWPVV